MSEARSARSLKYEPGGRLKYWRGMSERHRGIVRLQRKMVRQRATLRLCARDAAMLDSAREELEAAFGEQLAANKELEAAFSRHFAAFLRGELGDDPGEQYH